MNLNEWWNEYGFAMTPLPGDDYESHARRVAMAAAEMMMGNIKRHLLAEASEWSGDAGYTVFWALCSAADRIGIELSENECHMAMRQATT